MSWRSAILQRREAVVDQADRAVVDVEIELEPRPEQDVARVPVVGHSRIAERADEDGGEVVAQHPVAVGRKRFARGKKVISAPRQRLEIELSSPDAAVTAWSTFTASAITPSDPSAE